MELKKPIKFDYSERELEEYKGKLSSALIENGIDTAYTITNADAKNYIANWAEENIIKKEMHFKLQGYTFKFASLNLGVYNKDNDETSIKTFPIVNKYKGHNLVETIYFSLDKDGAILDKVIKVKNSSIILN